MPLRIRPNRIYQRRDSALRLLAEQAAPMIRRYMRQSLAHLRDDFDREKALRLALSGRWADIARDAIDWGHFREILRAPFARIAETHEAGAMIGVARINRAFAVAGRKVRFRKAFDPDQPRDDHGRWDGGGGSVVSPDRELGAALGQIPEIIQSLESFGKDQDAVGEFVMAVRSAAGKREMQLDETGGVTQSGRGLNENEIQPRESLEGALLTTAWTEADHAVQRAVNEIKNISHLANGNKPLGVAIRAMSQVAVSRGIVPGVKKRAPGQGGQVKGGMPTGMADDSLMDAIGLISKYSPDQARDDHGRWEGGGLSSAIREATAWVSGKSAGEIIAAGLGYAQNQKLALRLTQAAVNTLVGFVGQMDQGAMQTDMVNHEVEHVANNLRVSTARAKEMIRGAVVRLQEGRRQQLMKVETDPILRALQAVLDMLDRKPLDFSKAIADQFNFDRFDPTTQAMLREEQDRLIRELEVTARDTINQIGQDAMRAGLGPEATVDQIRDVIGLTARQAQAVVNYRSMLESLDATVLSRALRDPQYDSAIEAAIESGESFSAAAVDEMVSAYESRYLDYRAKTIADTESVRMTNQGLQDSYRQAVDRGAMPAEAVRQYWLVDPDEAKTCDVCLSIPDRNPNGVAMGEVFDSEEGPQDAPPIHPNCFTGETIVSAVGVRAATVRWFEGEVVVVRTAGCNEFSCTANHPILTDAGWVAAGLLRKGDRVIKRAVGKRKIGVNVDHQDVPTSIKEIAESFGRSPHVGSAEVPITAPDFHGDGVGSEVAIVWTDRQLRNGPKASRYEAIVNRALSGGHYPIGLDSIGPRDLFRFWHMAATHGIMRCLDLLRATFWRHLGPPYNFRFRGAPNWSAALGQPSPNGAAIDTKYFGDLQFGRSGQVAGDCLRRSWDFLFAVPNRLKAEAAERVLNPSVAYAKLAGDLQNGHFGPMERDAVVDVALRKFAGHVYNLETIDGFYVANGVIAHNCRCELSIETDISMLPDDEPKP